MVYTSKSPAKTYPNDQSMYKFLFSNINSVPDDQLIYMDVEDNNKSLTYHQVHTQILQCAAGIKKRWDIKYGDVVAICSPNQINYSIAVHGTVCAGGVVAAIDHESGIEKIADALDLVQAKYLIAHPETLISSIAAAKSVGLPIENILLFGDESVGDIQTVDQALLGEKELATPYPYTAEQIQNDPSYLYFTSGTTGAKKAVIITQSTIIATLSLKDKWLPVGTHTLAYTEFHHVSSLITAMHLPLFTGCVAYVMPHYTFENLCSAIEKYKISVTTTQPYIIAALAKDNIARNYDLSSLNFVYCAGAALELAVTLSVKERIGLKVINFYGMTEAIGVFDADESTSLINGIGYVASGFTAKTIDEQGNEVPQGEVGELLVKGPTITRGYYRNPKATANAIDAEGYLHTGDLVKCNEEGMFTYMTRCKDLIKYRLAHIHPTSIENVLLAHPKVADCAAVGVYSPELVTELPRAYILLNDGEKLNKEVVKELEEYSNSQLADEMRLRGGIIIVDSFPRTPSGKIQRRFLNTDLAAKITA